MRDVQLSPRDVTGVGSWGILLCTLCKEVRKVQEEYPSKQDMVAGDYQGGRAR